MNNRICYFKSISIIIFSFFFLNTAAHENKVIISSEISGPQNVCTGFPYIYGIEEEESGFIYVWEVEGGKTLGNNTGQQVTAVFTSPTGSISVVKQFVENGKMHRSEPKSLSVQRMVLDPKIINTSGSDVFYTSSVATFSLDLGSLEPDHIEWRFGSNNGNFGNIIEGFYEPDVTVSFNEINGSSRSVLIAEITKCGVTAVAAFEIQLQEKPLPNIKYKDCEYEGVPNLRFSLDHMVYNYDEPVTLTVPDYNPDYLYRWSFSGTHYFAEGPDTKIQFPNEGIGNIHLTIITPTGCAFTTPAEDTVVVVILKAMTQGTITPRPTCFCEGNLTPLSFVPMNPFDQSSKQLIWMCDNEEVSREMIYQPVQSGSYWPVIVDKQGNKDYSMVQYPLIYLIQKPPFVSINSPGTIVQGEELVLYGIVTDENVEYKWSGASLPEGFEDWNSENANTILKIKDLKPGTYDFTFHTRLSENLSCDNSYTVTVEVTDK